MQEWQHSMRLINNRISLKTTTKTWATETERKYCNNNNNSLSKLIIDNKYRVISVIYNVLIKLNI